MTMKELKKLRRDIDGEISEREDEERSEIMELVKGHLRKGEGVPQSAITENRKAHPRNGLIGTSEIAERLGVPKSQIYRLASQGSIPAVRIGKYYRFDYQEVVDSLATVKSDSNSKSGTRGA
jgi:excisionase family DNA binding protein